MRRRAAVRPRSAVTLLEVFLAMGLLVVLSSMTYWFYGSVLETRERGTTTARKLRLARVVLDRITREIRQAGATADDGSGGIRGRRERIRVSTLRLPGKETAAQRRKRDQVPPGEYDMTRVEYKIARHPEIKTEDGWERSLGLARVEMLVPRPGALPIETAVDGDQSDDGGGEQADVPEAPLEDEALSEDGVDIGAPDVGPTIQWEELYAPEIRYLRFCYYDGRSWWDDWDVAGESPLPQLVMVTIGFEGHPPVEKTLGQDRPNEEFCECLNRDPSDCRPLDRDQYSTVVRVTQSDPLFRSRVTRESQALVEELSGGGEKESGDGKEEGGP